MNHQADEPTVAAPTYTEMRRGENDVRTKYTFFIRNMRFERVLVFLIFDNYFSTCILKL